MSESAINEGLGIAVDQVTAALKRHGVDTSTGDLGAAIDALVERLQGVIERDRTVFCNLVVQLKDSVRMRQHLGDENARAASGYSYDEAGFIKEFAGAYSDFMSALDNAHRLFQDFTDCPKGGAIRAAQAEAAAILSKKAAAEPRGQYLAHITANQAENLLDAFGGGSTTYVLIRCEDGDSQLDDGTPGPAGLHIYDLNCPEEGVFYLGEEDEDSKPRDDDSEVIDAKYDNVLAPFARLMAKELHANADKGDRPGWLKMSAATAMLEIYYHAAKLQKAVKHGEGDRIREYAADVANMAMMLLDVCGGLEVSQ